MTDTATKDVTHLRNNMTITGTPQLWISFPAAAWTSFRNSIFSIFQYKIKETKIQKKKTEAEQNSSYKKEQEDPKL